MPTKGPKLHNTSASTQGSSFRYSVQERMDVTETWDNISPSIVTEWFDLRDLPGGNDLPESDDPFWSTIAGQVCLYGRKKLEDGTSSIKDDIRRKMAARAEIWERLMDGDWNGERKGSVRVPADLRDAIAELRGITAKQAEDALRGPYRDAWDELRASPKVAAILAEHASKVDVDLDDLLA